MNLDTTLKRNDAILASSIEDELVMFDADAGKYYGLNSVATEIWKQLEKPQTVQQLCDSLVSRFDISDQQCRQEVFEFLPGMIEKGLVSVLTEKE